MIKETVKKAMQNPEVKKIAKDYFLCSVFMSIQDDKDLLDEWILHFFNPKTKRVTDCYISNDIRLGEDSPAIKEMKRLDMSGVEIEPEQALETAKNDFDKKAINILMTLHKSKPVWTVNMITQDMAVTSYTIDAKSGELLEKKVTSLIRKI